MDLQDIITEDTHAKKLYKDIMWDIKYYTEERDKAQRKLEKSQLALDKFKEKYYIDETQL
jgi:hypothetical protein|tara:strand:+ start:269 stop:448 length:180 start_codon:yes stop_codon:yes gene_type:complete